MTLLLQTAALFAADSGGSPSDERQNSILRQEQHASSVEQSKSSEENIKEKKKTTEDILLLFGGSIGTTFRYYQNIDNQKILEDFLKWSWKQELYLWSYLNYRSTHSVLVRATMSNIDRAVGPTYTGIGADSEGPEIQSAFYRIDLLPVHHVPVKITTGRQYFSLGRGVVYSAFDDGCLLENDFSNFRQKHLLSMAAPRQDNIDYSVPGFDKEGDRVFFGSQTGYYGFEDTVLYGYGLIQKDKSSSNPENPRQNYHYNSHYLGAGFSAKPFKNAEWSSELIYEGGQSYTDALRTALRKTRIRGLAGVTSATYAFKIKRDPVLEAAYAYGSGDENRTSPTNTDGGAVTRMDRNFLYFGYYLAGYAFQPRLSNIHIVSIGGSAKPFPDFAPFQKMAVGTKFYFFRKDRESGGTSDLESTQVNKGLGEELDFYLHWKISDDWNGTLRVATFWPGKAFPETTRDKTGYFSAGLTRTF